jgi:hypothetical protein
LSLDFLFINLDASAIAVYEGDYAQHCIGRVKACYSPSLANLLKESLAMNVVWSAIALQRSSKSRDISKNGFDISISTILNDDQAQHFETIFGHSFLFNVENC